MPNQPAVDLERLECSCPDPRRDAEAIYDLTGRAFAPQGYWAWTEYCRTCYFHRNTYDWSASRIGRLDGKLVTHWGTWGYTMRIGRARVRLAGVGAVATDEAMKKRGLMTRTGRIALEACRNAGYDVSILFGRENFYELFGYVPAWPNLVYTVAVPRLPAAPPAGRVQRFKGSTRADLADAYNRHNATRTGTAVRPTVTAPWTAGRVGLLWADAHGAAEGYVVIEGGGESINVVDFAGEPEQVLRVVARHARAGGVKEVRFPELHAADPLALHLRRHFCRETFTWSGSGGAMALCLNLHSTLAKMAGELSHRLRRSDLAAWRGQILIAGPHEQVVLRLAAGKVSVHPAVGTVPNAIRGGHEIVQLLLGTADPDEIVSAGALRLSGQAHRLLGTLFPNQHCRLGAWDRF